MAANILIYGNDIGDTARNDLARAQIMDQRSRDAMGGMRQTSQFLQQKGLQEEGLKLREGELAESRKYREGIEKADRDARLQIAKDQRQAGIVETHRRALESGFLDPDSEGARLILGELSPKYRYTLEAMYDSARQSRAEEYGMFESRAGDLNRSVDEDVFRKPGFAWDSWGYRTEGEAAKQNEALRNSEEWEKAARAKLGTLDENLRPLFRFNPETRKIEPAIRPPKARTYVVDPMSVRSGGGTPAPAPVVRSPVVQPQGFDHEPWRGQPAPAPAPVIAPAPRWSVDPMSIPQGGGGSLPIQPPPAVAAGPPLPLQPQTSAGPDLLADPNDQQILERIAQQMIAQGVNPQDAYLMAMDELLNAKRAALPQQQAPAQQAPLMHNPMLGDPLMPGMRPY